MPDREVLARKEIDYHVERIIADANNETVATTKVLGAQYGALTVVSDEANWVVVGKWEAGAWLTWTPTMTGFSAGPTGGIYRYRRIDGEIEIELRQPSSGTINAGTFTISLPVQAATVTDMVWQGVCRVFNNGSAVNNPGYASIASGASVLELFINTGTTTWGTANGKRVDYLRMRYPV